jgi:hypothetical protein
MGSNATLIPPLLQYATTPFLRLDRVSLYQLPASTIFGGATLLRLAAYFPALLESACSIFRASNQHRSDKRLR